jgi:hypothetical protein
MTVRLTAESRVCSDSSGLTRACRAAFGTEEPTQLSGNVARNLGSISMELGGKGSFQAVKLQRPARTTVCSHSHKGHAAIGSIESKYDDKDTQDEYLSGCGQL